MKHNYLKGICGLLMIALVIVSLPKTVMADAEVKEEDTNMIAISLLERICLKK